MAKRSKHNYHLDPDEIFLDSSNLPSFNNQQFEGRIEKPISKFYLNLTAISFLLIGLVFAGRLAFLQVAQGKEFALRSQNNTLRHTAIFPERGIIYDRNGVELAWNDPSRKYIAKPGFAHVLGYLGYPTENDLADGTYHDKEYIGKDGVEDFYNTVLSGKKGIKIEEVDATGNIKTDHVLDPAESGKPLTLAIDSRLQEKFHSLIASVIRDRGFSGGAGVMMDVRTGEIIALTSFPEYDPNVLTSRSDNKLISQYFTDPNKPFMDRVVSGLYTPGSIVKPIMALGALTEGVISPEKKILSTGELVLPNPYDKTKNTVFKDWKAHGWVDMRRAIAVSSDVYFYEIGGGFKDQQGIGILNIEKYAKMFGLSKKTGIDLSGEVAGVIPNPEWKKENFDGEEWRVGNTYHTVIGQYGMQVTPLQVVRATSAIGNDGKLLKPTLLKIDQASSTAVMPAEKIAIAKENFRIVKEGMRLAAQEGSAAGLNVPYVAVAAKTGTAELGVSKERVNSWTEGFFPYEAPRYAFAVVLEKGARTNTIGGIFVMRQLFDWMNQNTPEYFK